VIISRQSFPDDPESSGLKTDNGVAKTETALEYPDKETVMALASPHTSLKNDTAGKTEQHKQQEKKKWIRPRGPHRALGIKHKTSLKPSQPADNKEFVSSTRPFAGKKSNPPGRSGLATTRKARPGKPNRNHKHQVQKKGRTATGRRGSRIKLLNTAMKSKLRGGSRWFVSSSVQVKELEKIAYDPLYGFHVIPCVKTDCLLEAVADDENCIKAILKVRKKPEKSPGCDEKTVVEVCDSLISDPLQREAIQQDILTGNYWPAPVVERLIPKSKGKMRAIGIAIVKDRIVQRMILQAIESALAKNTWSPNSFAYTEGRGPKEAIARVDELRRRGYTWAIALDLKAFFDNVPHDRLKAKIGKFIVDKRVVDLIVRFITPLILGENGKVRRNRKGTPQGSVISPILASKLYLDELDQEMTRHGWNFVRYADDVTVFCKSKAAAKRIRRQLLKIVGEEMLCPPNEDKTHIVNVKELALLGVYLKRGKWHISRKKILGMRACFADGLKKVKRSGSDYDLSKLIDQMHSFLNHYKRICPSLAKEAESTLQWCKRVWMTIIGPETERQKLWLQQYKRL
jgi:group II intron reverse transcriptase/maturase